MSLSIQPRNKNEGINWSGGSGLSWGGVHSEGGKGEKVTEGRVYMDRGSTYKGEHIGYNLR